MDITAHSPKCTERGEIVLTVKFPWLDEEVEFLASPNDPMEYGREIYAAAVRGCFGNVENP